MEEFKLNGKTIALPRHILSPESLQYAKQEKKKREIQETEEKIKSEIYHICMKDVQHGARDKKTEEAFDTYDKLLKLFDQFKKCQC